jgi:predicted amidohydrolase YtcJ
VSGAAFSSASTSITTPMLSGRSLILTLAVACTLGLLPAAEAPADLVVTQGRVLTVDAKFSIAEAVAVRGNRFVYVGSADGAKALIGPRTRVINAQGRSVVPGLIETHVHAVGVARDQADEPFRQLSSLADIRAWLREKDARTKPGDWIRIIRVDLTRFKEGRFPTRAELDEMLPHRPVVFDWSYAGINQVQVLNSAALKAAGITRDTPAPPQGRIVMDAAGNPTGMIRNARALIERYLPAAPKLDRAALLSGLERVHGHYHAVGITSINDRRADPDVYSLYQELKAQGRLKVRTTITMGIGYQGTGNALKQLQALPYRPGEGDDWLRLGPLKIRIDGGLLYGTAYLREPFLAEGSARYYEIPGGNNRGELMTPAADVTAIFRAAHAAGWQLSAHVAGDAGVDVVLDALEAADRDQPIAPRRFNLIHAYLPNRETAQRARRLGAVVDTQPVMYYKDGDALLQTLGPERAARVYGLQEWVKAGVKVAINADHMQGLDPDQSLQPYNPFLALYIAVSRKTESGRVYGPAQAVSREQAMRMITADAAYLSFDETNRGSIEVGKLADLAILSDDYMKCQEEQIRRIKVLTTVLDGKVVYERAGGAN